MVRWSTVALFTAAAVVVACAAAAETGSKFRKIILIPLCIYATK